MERAIERHKSGKTRVIPLLLRSTDWQSTYLGKLQALPLDAKGRIKPVNQWRDQDTGLNAIVLGIRKVIEESEPKFQEIPSFSSELLLLLNKHKEMRRTQNTPFQTPHLLYALFEIKNSRTLYHLENVNPFQTTKFQKRLDEYIEAILTKKETFSDFQWELREDVWNAQRLALKDGSNEVTEEYLLLGILANNTSKTVQVLRGLFGSDDFQKLVMNIQEALRPTQLEGTFDLPLVPTFDEMSTLDNISHT